MNSWKGLAPSSSQASTKDGFIELTINFRYINSCDYKELVTAIKEANKLGIPVICLADTNADPDGITPFRNTNFFGKQILSAWQIPSGD